MSPVLLTFIIAFIYGTTMVIHRVASRTISNAVMLLVSSSAYFVATLIYILMWHKGTIIYKLKEAKTWIAILGVTAFIGMFVANLLYFHVVRDTPNINVSVTIIALYPIVTLVLATIFLNERLSLYGIVGFFLVFSGVSLMLLN